MQPSQPYNDPTAQRSWQSAPVLLGHFSSVLEPQHQRCERGSERSIFFCLGTGVGILKHKWVVRRSSPFHTSENETGHSAAVTQ